MPLRRVTHTVFNDPDFFPIFQKIIRNPAFDYQVSTPKIEKEVSVRNLGLFQVEVDWQSPDICGIEIYRKI